MYKIFLVKENSRAEASIKKLIDTGRKGIPVFEKELGIIDFCLDLEVIANGIINPKMFLVISGFTERIKYRNADLQEVSIEHIKSTIHEGYCFAAAGTSNFFRVAGYCVSPFNQYLNRIELFPEYACKGDRE